MLSQLLSTTLMCSGGMTSSRNWLELSASAPGIATDLVNMEPSLFGGYRKINGYVAIGEEVGEGTHEGPILGLAFFNGTILAARKEIGVNNYDWFYYVSGTGWINLNHNVTLSATGVLRIRFATFNFDGTNRIAFADGVNNLTIYDGSTWTQYASSDPNNNQIIDAPKYVAVFQNHLFISGDSSASHVVAHSAPLDATDWDTASGAGQIVTGFPVVQIAPFRDELYVFGERQIKKILVSQTTFLINDVTKNLGCVASDSVIEINGDLLFLSQDGFRPISATERNNDVELGSVSKAIQADLNSLLLAYPEELVTAVVIRKKSQVRFFFHTMSQSESLAQGIIGGLVLGEQGVHWEWGKLLGIKPTCCMSFYLGTEEWVVHGGYDGFVYRQEQGSTFNGEPILSVYKSPYIDFGDPSVRKTLHKISLFVTKEGDLDLNVGVRYNWDSKSAVNPADYVAAQGGTSSTYGFALYGVSTYSSVESPVTLVNIQGSGFSSQFAFVSYDKNPPFTIHGYVVEYSADGKK